MKRIMLSIIVILNIAIVARGQQSKFACPSQEQTDLCNTDILPIYDDCVANNKFDENCGICLFGCTLVTQMNETAAGLTCANDTCVSDVCSSYGLFYNNSFGFSCRDVYSDQYCSYCEKCYSFRSDECSTDYKTTFCRLFHVDQLTDISCFSVYGEIPCGDCAEILQAQTCDSLSLDSLTTQQNDTLCEIGPSCNSLPPAINCTSNEDLAFDCRLCSYLFDNNFDCEFTPTSGPTPAECLTSNGLFCSLVNTADPCDSSYSQTTCTDCNSFSFCPAIDIQAIGMAEQSILCNSADAANCGVSVSLVYGECLNTSSPSACDYCKATLPVCNYMPVDNGNGTDGNLNISCNSTAISTCGYDVTFFPCALIHGLDYCANCIDALEFCGGIPEYDDDDVPPHLCEDDYYVSLCDLFVNELAEDCNGLLGNEVCDFCKDVVLVNCSSSLNTDTTLDLFCSNSTLDICLNAVDNNELCLDVDCIVCTARGTICEQYFLEADIEERDCSYTSEDIFCRIYGSNVTTCPSVYDSSLCQSCQSTIVSCSILELDKLPPIEQYLVCSNSDVCSSVSSVDSFCRQEDRYARFCETCQAFSSQCDNTSSISHSFCDDEIGSLFCRSFALNLTDCQSRFMSGYCGLCQQTLLFCPVISLDDFTDNQTAIACQYSEICDVYINSPSLCQQDEDTAFLCDICIGFQGLCNSNSSGTPSVCTGDIGSGCYISYTYFPCYSTANDSSGCDICTSLVDICPGLVFNASFVPFEVCNDTTYLSSCSLIVNDPFCELYYGQLTCEYCQTVVDQCQVSINYVTVATVLDESCDTYYATCQYLLSTVSASECMNTYTFADCAFCGVLISYCPSRVGSYPNCSSELDYFCANISAIDNCAEQYVSSTCYDCDVYNDLCRIENTTASVDEFCSSTEYLFHCSSIPVGPTCRHLIPEESFLCDYCSLYTERCIDSICSVDNLLMQCSSLYSNGSVPTVYIDQCLPCSLVSGVCENYTVVMQSSSISASMITATSTSTSTSTMSATGTAIFTSTDTTSLLMTSSSSSAVISSTDQITTETTQQMTTSTMVNTVSTGQSSIQMTETTVPPSTETVITTQPTASMDDTVTTVPPSTETVITTQPTASMDDTVTTVPPSTETMVQPSTETTSISQPPLSSVDGTTSQPLTNTPVASSTMTVSLTTTTREVATSTTSMTTRGGVSSMTSSTSSPVRSSTPVSDIVSNDDLTDAQRDNAVTMVFEGLTLSTFTTNTDKFISDIEMTIYDVLNNRRRRQTSSTSVRVMIIDESVDELPNMELQFSIIASQGSSSGSSIISGSTLERIVENNGASLAQSIGAASFASVRAGVPDSLATDDTGSSGLSSGATAGIVIAVLVLVIVALSVIAIGVYVYAIRNRKGRYFISDQHDFTKGHELSVSQSMKEANPESVPTSNVIKNEEAINDVSKEKKKEKEVKEAEAAESTMIETRADSSDSKSSSGSSSSSDDENTEF